MERKKRRQLAIGLKVLDSETKISGGGGGGGGGERHFRQYEKETETENGRGGLVKTFCF